jgi:hypothetical protein
MRLRQLGSTQSIVFFAPPEVHKNIIEVCKPKPEEVVNSSHVITWLLEQTCRANEQQQHLYMAQGKDFCRRMDAQWKYSDFLTDESHRNSLLQVIQHPERQTLQQLYGKRSKGGPLGSTVHMSCPILKHFAHRLRDMATSSKAVQVTVNSSAMEEVEQEREVEFQVEEVREVQQPAHYNALEFPGLHPAMTRFAITGSLTGGDGYEHAFKALARTTIGKKFEVCCTQSRFFVSMQYMRTVDLGRQEPNDNFLVSTLSGISQHAG